MTDTKPVFRMYTRNFLVECADTPASTKAPPGLDEVIKDLRGMKMKTLEKKQGSGRQTTKTDYVPKFSKSHHPQISVPDSKFSF